MQRRVAGPNLPCFREIPLALGDSNEPLQKKLSHPATAWALYILSMAYAVGDFAQKGGDHYPPTR
jgi:hypothetical protein